MRKITYKTKFFKSKIKRYYKSNLNLVTKNRYAFVDIDKHIFFFNLKDIYKHNDSDNLLYQAIAHEHIHKVLFELFGYKISSKFDKIDIWNYGIKDNKGILYLKISGY